MSLDSGSAAAYEYDGLHRRTTRTEAGVAKHFYYNERWQVLTETDASGTAQAIYSYFPHYVDAVAVRMTPASDHFYLCDALASVTAIVDNETDAVVERYAYSPYGRITVLDADYAVDEDNTSDIGNELLYTGRRTDPGTGLQINRHRYYHAPLGRWVNRDPVKFKGGTSNLYEYANSKSTLLKDSHGLRACCGGKRKPGGHASKNLFCCGNEKVGAWLTTGGKACCKDASTGTIGRRRKNWELAGYQSARDCILSIIGEANRDYVETELLVGFGAFFAPAMGAGFTFGFPAQYIAADAFCSRPTGPCIDKNTSVGPIGPAPVFR